MKPFEIHLATIRRIVEIEKEKEAVAKYNVKLQEEKARRRWQGRKNVKN